jgi:hypothetical protein
MEPELIPIFIPMYNDVTYACVALNIVSTDKFRFVLTTFYAVQLPTKPPTGWNSFTEIDILIATALEHSLQI